MKKFYNLGARFSREKSQISFVLVINFKILTDVGILKFMT